MKAEYTHSKGLGGGGGGGGIGQDEVLLELERILAPSPLTSSAFSDV